MTPPFEPLLGTKERRALDAMRPVLAAAGLPAPDMRRIAITMKSIREFSTYDDLTRAILEHDMPAITGTKTLDHYTSVLGYQGIISTQELHLAPVTHRLGDGEFELFARIHGLRGYLNDRGLAGPDLKDATDDLFYTSFTEPAPKDDLWRKFADSGAGYRIRFAVTPGDAELRQVRYHSGKTVLRQVNEALAEAGLPAFILKGVSYVGAFYLPEAWETEGETRLLARCAPDGSSRVVTTPKGKRWPVSIDRADLTADLKLIEIGVRNRDPSLIRSRLPEWCSKVPVVLDKRT